MKNKHQQIALNFPYSHRLLEVQRVGQRRNLIEWGHLLNFTLQSANVFFQNFTIYFA
jgi:hypothetical protein